MKIAPGYASLPARSHGWKTHRRPAARCGPDERDCKRKLFDASAATSGAFASDQYVSRRDCALPSDAYPGIFLGALYATIPRCDNFALLFFLVVRMVTPFRLCPTDASGERKGAWG